MTDNDVYQFLKKKIHEGKKEDEEVELQRIAELEEVQRTYRFLEDLYEKYKEEIKKYPLIPEKWLEPVKYAVWEKEYFWKMRPHWAFEHGQNQWLPNFIDGHYLTKGLSFREIAEGTGCSVKEVKLFINSLEKDGLIGKMKMEGFYPYRWFVNESLKKECACLP